MPALLAPALISLGVSAGTAPILSEVLFTGLSIALSIYFAPSVPKPEDGKNPFQQAVPTRTRIIGKRRTAGAFMLYHASDSGAFYGISALCEGPAYSFGFFYLHDDKILEFKDGTDTTLALLTVVSPGEGRYGDDKIQIATRLGVNPETAYPDAFESDIWTSFHRGDGICSAFLRCADAGSDNQSIRFPFGIPVLSVVVDATKVYDPRQDELQNWADRTTWGNYSAGENPNSNPILQALWMLTAPIEEGGFGLDMAETFVPVFGAIKAQADICDVPVNLKAGGTQPRYRSGAMYRFNDPPGDVLSAILGTCDGFCAENGDGTFTLKAGHWDDDDFSVVILDKHIISLNVKRFRADEDETTGVIVKYNSVAHEHTTIDAPVWPRNAYQGGEDKRVRSIDITYCPDGLQAQRLSKRVAIYEMAPVSGSAVLKMWGVQLLNKRGATIQCTDDPALADCKVRLTRVEPNLIDGTVSIDFTVFDPVVCDAWDPATEEGKLQPVVIVPYHGTFSSPSNLNAVASQIADIIVLEVSFDPGSVATNKTSFFYRYRIADIGGGVPGQWISGDIHYDIVERPSPLSWIISVYNVPRLYLEIQLEAHQHDHSAWSVSAFVHGEAPTAGRPFNFTATKVGADVVLNWTAPNSANMDHARVYRQAPAGGSFASATDVSGPVAGTTLALMTFTDVAPAAATYDYWVLAYSVLDVGSLPRGPVTITIP